MSTFANIITNCVFFFVFAIIMLVSILIFIQAIIDLWDNIGRDVFRSIEDWFHRTDVGARMINEKNGVTILTDEEYEEMLYGGQIKHNIIIDNNKEE